MTEVQVAVQAPAIQEWPVVELFGPTIQGEGPAQGERCWFLRMGGCDYRCAWCDTMYAVDPKQWKPNAERLNTMSIALRLSIMGMRTGGLLVLSGGNPAIHELGPLVSRLNEARVRIHVETQGTVFRSWLNECELVVVSPKPPSALGEKKAAAGLRRLAHFLSMVEVPTAVKVVAFDERDLDFAREVLRVPWVPKDAAYLSAGTAQDGDLALNVVERFAWLCNRHIERDDLAAYRVGLQAHVLAWPGERNR